MLRRMSDAPLQFKLESTSGRARAGRMTTPHGTVSTPTFMPVGTHGALKAMTTDHARATGSQILLGNTYHLALRPGEELVEKLGGPDPLIDVERHDVVLHYVNTLPHDGKEKL